MLKVGKRFFLLCSGATMFVLDQEECLTEQNKYAGIGATVFFTACLATLSGGYALFSVFNSAISAAGFGLLWGVMIFNLDRFIVSSIRSRGKNQPGTAISFKQRFEPFLVALPRILLAVFLSIVITKPLEMKFYEKEISAQLGRDNTRILTDRASEINQEFKDVTENQARLDGLLGEINATEQNLLNAKTKTLGELDGVKGAGYSGKAGHGVRAKLHESELNTLTNKLSELKANPEIQRLREDIEARANAKRERIAQAGVEVENRSGLAARLAAISNLGKEDSIYAVISSFIILLFILIETAPIVAKFLSRYGPYDQYFDKKEAAAMQLAEERTQLWLDIQRALDAELIKNMQKGDREEFLTACADLERRYYAKWRQQGLMEFPAKSKAKGAG